MFEKGTIVYPRPESMDLILKKTNFLQNGFDGFYVSDSSLNGILTLYPWVESDDEVFFDSCTEWHYSHFVQLRAFGEGEIIEINRKDEPNLKESSDSKELVLSQINDKIRSLYESSEKFKAILELLK